MGSKGLKSNNSFSRFLLKYLKPFLGYELLLILLLLGTTACALASPYILKVIIDDVFPSGDYQFLIEVLFILVGIYVVRISLNFCTDYLDVWISNNIMKNIRTELFDHVIRLPMSFFSSKESGDILHRVSNEVSVVQETLSNTLVRLMTNTFTIVITVSMLIYLDWELFLVTSVIYPLTIINIRIFHPRIRKIQKKLRQDDSQILNFLTERLKSIKLIKSFNNYNYENRIFTQRIDSFISSELKSTLLSSSTTAISTILIALCPILVFGWGGRSVLTGALSLGSLVAFLQYLNRLFPPIRDFMSLYMDVVKTSVSTDRIQEFLEETQEDPGPAPKQTGSLPRIKRITFENVHFSYGNKKVLKDLSLILEAGKAYALVGPSGGGKSTILDLICKFIKADQGAIYVNDRQLEDINTEELRRQISLIPQKTQLFHDSIRENITYGRTIDNEAIEATAKMAGIQDYIENLEKGLDSILGGTGDNISGGQIQRIAITRGLLSKFDILILDEATSAVDAATDHQILDEIIRAHQDKIIIIVSHRSSTVRKAQEIIYLDDGKVLEQGNHESLNQQQSHYRSLFHADA